MDAAQVAARIERTGIVVIVRGSYSLSELQVIGDALAEGGVRVLEVTLNSTNALAGIEKLRERLPPDALVGAGTVLTREDVDAAIDAGAQFLIAPDMKGACMERASDRGTLFVPGVFTASEVGRAVELGCSLLKLFPASIVGPDYLRAMLGPFPNVRFMPTGGIGMHHIESYLQAGAAALGMGSTLIGSGAPQASKISHDAGRLIHEVQRVRATLAGRAF